MGMRLDEGVDEACKDYSEGMEGLPVAAGSQLPRVSHALTPHVGDRPLDVRVLPFLPPLRTSLASILQK